ncbi:nuclear transport factor 2 family protein [Streptomyces sp. 4N509B]|uniref:nuclear transport factor 2 family protein n=1 Tax=Streptomyces sp. 4N509B TaxID=3457413 RepID=UPI003FD2F870
MNENENEHEHTDEGTVAARNVDGYLRFWNAEAPEEQRRLASATFTDDVEYRAPVGVLSGPSALMGFREQFAGHMGAVVFRARRDPEIHHGRARLLWAIDADGKEPFATGTDVLVLDADGRISAITTFLDQAPEGFDPDAHGDDHAHHGHGGDDG